MDDDFADDRLGPAEPLFEPKTKSGGRSKIVIVLAVFGAGTAIVIIACCGFGVWSIGGAAAETPAARASVERFLNEIQSGNRDSAYENTAKPFQQATTNEQFRGLLDAAPILTAHRSRTVSMLKVQKTTRGDYAVFRVTFEEGEARGAATITTLKQDGQWKVGGLNTDATALQKPSADRNVPSADAIQPKQQ